MTADEDVLRELRRLPALQPDEVWADRVRARCRAAIARRHLQFERSKRAPFSVRALESALVGGLGLIYLSAIINDVLRLYGIG